MMKNLILLRLIITIHNTKKICGHNMASLCYGNKRGDAWDFVIDKFLNYYKL